ncbi:MAG: hypothetical protein RL757_2909 [Bacteroidota bacterium]|jgi:cell division septation protein DedD
MGSNTVRNLTWAAVAACIVSLFLLIKQSANKATASATADSSIMNATNPPFGNGAAAENNSLSVDTSVSPKSLAGGAVGAVAAAGDAVAGAANNAAGAVASGAQDVASQYSSKGKAVPEQSILPVEAPATTSSKTAKGSKTASKPTKVVPKFDAGNKTGDFMVIAGTYASKDNANIQISKLKKMGFANAEMLKFENTANYSVVSGAYGFRGTADAAVRTLAKNKISAFVRKRSGEIFKPSSTAAVAGPPKPASK